MKLFEEINLLQRLDQLIRLKATGTPEQLAQKFNLSDRQMRRIIEELKDRGVPIDYSKRRQSYYYTDDVFMKFEIHVVEDKTVRKIIGGEGINYDFLKDILQTDIFCPPTLAPLYQVDKQRRKKSMLAPFFDALLGY